MTNEPKTSPAAPESPTPSLRAMMAPRSVAIVGMSNKPGSSGRNLLNNIRQDGFSGPIHLVGRSGGEIDGAPVLTSTDDLPSGIDLALLAVPARGAVDAVEGCVNRGVASAIIYASGFAELGDEGSDLQTRMAQAARRGGLLLAGPNCIGNTNYVDGFTSIFLPQAPTPRIPAGTTNAIAVIAQSGGLMGMMTQGLEERGVPASHRISAGNEAVLTLADYLDYLIEDPSTAGAALYVEQIRDPQAFLRAVRKARNLGKFVVLMHSGRSMRGQHATSSHTGSLAGDYNVMKTLVAQAGGCVVESLEELLDVAEILSHYPEPPTAGIGVVTTSGAFCAIALDTIEPLGIDVPALSAPVEEVLRNRLPDYMPPQNPLDIGTLVVVDPQLYRDSVAALLADEGIGSVVLGIPFVDHESNRVMLQNVAEAAKGSRKPVLAGLFSDVTPVGDELRAIASSAGVVVSNSPERLIRALAAVTKYGLHSPHKASAELPLTKVTTPLRSGPQPEWIGKALLSELGIPVPAGHLASSLEQALEVADKFSYPVVAKIQAVTLTHKTEAGAVILNIGDEAALRAAWQELEQRADAAGLTDIDGILVEEMAAPGVELVVGAKRHPSWGPTVLVGIGGVSVEVLKDVRLLPADTSADEVIAALTSLKAAKLLGAFRGSAAVDLRAVADVVTTVGRLMVARPDIIELDINPLLARPDGVRALDALVICDTPEAGTS